MFVSAWKAKLRINQKIRVLMFDKYNVKFFTGKTETGWKFTTPKMRMKKVRPIFPPPGMNLQIPGN